MPAVSPYPQLKVALDSIATTVAVGDDYLRVNDLPHALNSYRTAGAQFAGLPPYAGSAAIVAQVAAITSATTAGIAQARALLDKLFLLYEPTPGVVAPPPSSVPTIAILGTAGALALVVVLVLASKRRRRRR